MQQKLAGREAWQLEVDEQLRWYKRTWLSQATNHVRCLSSGRARKCSIRKLCSTCG